MVCRPDGKKFYVPACDRQTDRRTDILPQHSLRYAYASRGKSEILAIAAQIRPFWIFLLCMREMYYVSTSGLKCDVRFGPDFPLKEDILALFSEDLLILSTFVHNVGVLGCKFGIP